MKLCGYKKDIMRQAIMTNPLLLLLVLLSLHANAQNQVTCTAGCSVLPTSFPSFDLAVSFALDFKEVVLSLSVSPANYQANSVLLVQHNLYIQGNNQTLIFAAPLQVQAGAELKIMQTNMKGNGPRIDHFLEVYGKLRIEDCLIERFESPFISLFGTLLIAKVKIRSNVNVLISVSKVGTTVQILAGTVSNHTGPFLEVLQTPSVLLIADCTFTGNSGFKALLYVSSAVSEMLGHMSISSCLFTNNSVPLIYLNVRQTDVKVTNCSFLMNSHGVVAEYLASSSLEVTACTWNDNGGVALDLLNLQGIVSIANSSLSHQRDKGFIRAAGTAGSSCFVSLAHSSFSDTHVTTTGLTPGVLWLELCSGRLHNISISQVIVATDNLSFLRGLLYAFYGSLSLTDVYTEDSGSSGALVGVGLGDMNISNGRFVNPFTVVGFFIFCLGANTTGTNITITAGQHPPGTDPPNYFSAVGSKIYFSQVRILGNNQETSTAFSISGCDFGLSQVYIESVLQYDVLIIMLSRGFIKDFEMRNSSYSICLFGYSQTNFTMENVNLAHLSPFKKSHIRISCITRKSNISISEISVSNMSFTSLIAATSAVVIVRNVTIRNCRVEEGIIENVYADIVMRGVDMRNLRIGKLLLANEGGNMIEGLVLENIEVDNALFQLLTGIVSISNAIVRSCHSHSSFGVMKDNSQLSISDSTWDEISTEASQGFELFSGHLVVRNCSFANFRMSLFQVTNASVQIENSRFRNGVSPEKSLKSRYIYGGVLGCVNCLSVLIDNIKVWNVSAIRGGAIAIRNNNNYPVIIKMSIFIGCEANSGGALFFQNTSFLVDNCTFNSNRAGGRGGALDADIRKSDENAVSDSVFMHNLAIEGGAIKWHNAPIILRNVLYSENNALYGPNLASYGVSLSTRLTHLSGAEATGMPLTLIFELVDHYGNPVLTASEQTLELLNTSSVGFLGTRVRFINNGVFNYSDLIVFAQPGSTQAVTAYLITNEGNYNLDIQTTIWISFRNCTSGEVQLADRCELCPSGYFSFYPSDSKCRNCPNHVSCGGGNSFSLEAKHWRNASDSVDVLPCPLMDKCLGGENSTCAEGFTGVLCNQCAGGYYRFRSTECKNCYHWVFFGMQVAAVLLLCGLIAYGVLRFSVYSPNTSKLFLIKTLLSHLQYLSALSFLRVSFPSPITYSLHTASYMSSLLITDLPLSCYGVSSPEYTQAIIGSLVLPVIILAGLLVIWRKREIVTQVLMVMTAQLMCTPVITVLSTLPLISCYEVPSKLVLFADMSEECWSPAHNTYIYAFLVPSLTLNFLIPLAAVVFFMKRQRGELSKYVTIWKSGYNVFLWDLVLLLFRAAHASVLIGTQASPQLAQLCYGLIVLICICVVNVSLQPWVYHHKHLFFLSEASLLVISLSQGMTVYYVNSSPGNSWLDYLINAAFVGLNGGLVAFICFCVISNVRIFPDLDMLTHHKDRAELKVPDNSVNSSMSLAR